MSKQVCFLALKVHHANDSAQMCYERNSRAPRLMPNENVNEHLDKEGGEQPQKPAWLFLQVDLAQKSCGLALSDWPLCSDTWAKMADRDILNVWVTAAFLSAGRRLGQEGSAACNVIRCKFYTEEIYVIKTAYISRESNP